MNSSENLGNFYDYFKTAPVAMACYRLDGEIFAVNNKFTALLGYQLDDIPTTEDWYRQAYPDPHYRQTVREAWDSDLARALKNRSELDVGVYRISKKDQTIQEFAITASVFNENVIVTFTDLNDSLRIEQRLEHSARRAEGLLKIQQAATELNETDFMQFGQEIAEEITDSCISFIHFINDDDTIELVTWSRRTLEHFCNAVYEKHYPIADAGIWADACRYKSPIVLNDYPNAPHKHGLPEGHAALSRIASVPVIESGRVVMIAGVGNKPSDYEDRDIETLQLISHAIWASVQRRRNEGQLRNLSRAVEQSQESVVITNPEGEIEYVNQAFERSSGYSSDDVLGKNPRILQSGKTSPGTFRQMWRALKKGQAWRGELSNKTRDGREYLESAVISPIRDSDGQVSHYVAVKQDITERKRLERELETHRSHLAQLVRERTQALEQERERAQQANQAKSRFLANMSHEIRTPMNAIINLARLINRDTMSDQQAIYLDRIDSSAQHLLSVINDILDVSRIEAGKLELCMADFALEDVINDVFMLMRDAAQEKRLQIKLDLDQLPTWVKGDATRLRQALFNYAGNALKFTDTGTITIRAMMVSEQGEELLLRFEVEDTGVGIEPEKLPRLFQDFEQVDDSATRRQGGTGLGLSITRHIASLMGGDVGAVSEPGRGSLFWFTAKLQRGMPVDDAGTRVAAEDALQRLRANLGQTPHRVLVAEDNLINLDVSVELLQRAGLQVDTAQDGAEAIEKVSQADYALVLMDVQMPRMDGLEATRRLRREPKHRTLPILAMTASVLDEDRRACLSAGMNAFLSKPVDPGMLYQECLRWLTFDQQDNPTDKRDAITRQGVSWRIRQQLSDCGCLQSAILEELTEGELPVFVEKLRDYVTTYLHVPERLGRLLASRELGAAVTLAHEVANGASRLGLHKIERAAQELIVQLDARRLVELSSVMASLDSAFLELKQAIVSTVTGSIDEPSKVHHDTAATLSAEQNDETVKRRRYGNRLVADAEQFLAELPQCWAHRNNDRARFLAHRTKSAARTVGAVAFGDSCERLEVAASAGDWAAMTTAREDCQVDLAAFKASLLTLADEQTTDKISSPA
jgi:PAS domain S-box-containing protein